MKYAVFAIIWFLVGAFTVMLGISHGYVEYHGRDIICGKRNDSKGENTN
jgi:hypothetical protein